MWIFFPKLLRTLNITSDSLCFCWSEKNYWECCMKSIHAPWLSKEELESMNPKNYNWVLPPSYFEKVMFKLSHKCLICENKAIKSHSISSNRIKNTFNSDFVSTVLQDKYQRFVLKKVPINDVSAFPIRCSFHDQEIFKPIDEQIDLNDTHHLNLLAYRALGREFRLQSDRTKILYSFIYQFFATQLKNLLCEYYKRTSETYEMMKYVEYWIKNRNWRWLKHKIFEIWKIEPVFLSSEISACRYKDWMKKQETCMLNLITIDNEWYFIISYKEYNKDSEDLYKRINKSYKSWNIISFLNDFIWKNCHNIICDEKRAWEIIQTPEDWRLYENWAHDYIRVLL